MTVKRTRHGQAENVRFDRPFLLLVEGGDDEAFGAAQIDQVGQSQLWQIHNMGGNTTGWGPALAVILDDEWFSENGLAIGLVMDADTDADAVLAKCESILRNNGLPVPGDVGTAVSMARRTAIFVMPGEDPQGALEDLLLRACEPARLAAAESYLAGLDSAGLGGFSRRSKSLVQAYLAGQPELTKTIVVGLQRGEVFPPDSAAFESFRDFLRGLADPGLLS